MDFLVGISAGMPLKAPVGLFVLSRRFCGRMLTKVNSHTYMPDTEGVTSKAVIVPVSKPTASSAKTVGTLLMIITRGIRSFASGDWRIGLSAPPTSISFEGDFL